MELSIVIVSWNVRQDLIQCLESLYKYPASGTSEVIVIDNASTDGTIDAIATKFPQAIVIVNNRNSGFAAANNQGIERAQGKYILLLNPDTTVHSGSLDILIRFMNENEDVGICGPQLLNKDGTIQPSVRCFPTFRGALYRHTVLRYLRIFRKEYKKWLMKDFDCKTGIEVDQVMGAALLVRKAVVDGIGIMDETFFMYYEEVDLCYRAKQGGWKVAFVPDAKITHLAGKSSGQIPVEKRMMMLASLIKFFRKHRGKNTTALFNCFFKPFVILRDICDVAAASAAYLYGLIIMDESRCKKSAAKVGNSLKLICTYSRQILFKM